MNLFQRGSFQLHSSTSDVKIDCDALTYDDYATLAYSIDKSYSFTEAYGVPNGGLPLAAALQRYCTPFKGQDKVLVVDDVYTTGDSMAQYMYGIRKERPHAEVFGVVIFNRGGIRSKDISAIFTTTLFPFRRNTVDSLNVSSGSDARRDLYGPRDD